MYIILERNPELYFNFGDSVDLDNVSKLKKIKKFKLSK